MEGVAGLRFVMLWDMRVMVVAQAPTKKSGTIILGRILPCIRRKRGHFECFPMSLGPTYQPRVSFALPSSDSPSNSRLHHPDDPEKPKTPHRIKPTK